VPIIKPSTEAARGPRLANETPKHLAASQDKPKP